MDSLRRSMRFGELLLLFAVPEEGDHGVALVFGLAQRLSDFIEHQLPRGVIGREVDRIHKRRERIFKHVKRAVV